MTEAERNQIVLDNTKLVWKITHKICRSWWSRYLGDKEDVFQEGLIGLLKAVERYNPELGSFGTIAYHYIYGYIMRAIQQCMMIHIPAHLIGDVFKEDILGKPKDLAERIADGKRALSFWSLDMDSEDDGWTLGSKLPDHREKPAHEATDLQDTIADCLAALEPRQREVIEKRFGIGCEVKALKDVSKELGISRQRVQQVQDKAMVALRKRMDRGLHPRDFKKGECYERASR